MKVTIELDTNSTKDSDILNTLFSKKETVIEIDSKDTPISDFLDKSNLCNRINSALLSQVDTVSELKELIEKTPISKRSHKPYYSNKGLYALRGLGITSIIEIIEEWNKYNLNKL